MFGKISPIYKCARCGEQVTAKELDLPYTSQRALARCPSCGYRVLKRAEPLTNEYVKTTYLDHYNKFVDRGLQEVVSGLGEIEIKSPVCSFKVKLGEVRFMYPLTDITQPYISEYDSTIHAVYPKEALFRGLTYASPLSIEMTHYIAEEPPPGWSELVFIGDLPVMVKSKLCALSHLSTDDLIKQGEDPNDPGGYFIIKGAKKVVLPDYFPRIFQVSLLKLLWKMKLKLERPRKTAILLSKVIRPDLANEIINSIELADVQIARLSTNEEIVYQPASWVNLDLMLKQSLSYYVQQLKGHQ